MNSIEKTAKKLRKEIKNTVSSEDIIGYLKTMGYSVVFYGERHDLLAQYDLVEYAKSVNAFTYYDDDLNIVFINEAMSENDKIYSLLHELSHIELGHIQKRAALRNERREEMEAEVLAYNIINPQKQSIVKFLPYIIVITIILVLGALAPRNEGTSSVHTSVTADYVYLVPTGAKFHRSSCIHAQTETRAQIEKKEAVKILKPCNVCNP